LNWWKTERNLPKSIFWSRSSEEQLILPYTEVDMEAFAALHTGREKRSIALPFHLSTAFRTFKLVHRNFLLYLVYPVELELPILQIHHYYV
jgi:hypothetical protein